jgi:hypothetical protein
VGNIKHSMKQTHLHILSKVVVDLLSFMISKGVGAAQVFEGGDGVGFQPNCEGITFPRYLLFTIMTVVNKRAFGGVRIRCVPYQTTN